MKKITTILMLLMLTCMGAWAAGESLTYSISKTTGAFNAGSGAFFHTWTSNEGITPVVTLKRTSGQNDMQWDGDKFKFHANGGLDYIITMPAEFTIDKLEATFSDGTARESYVTINGVQKRINAGQTITLTFDGLSGNTVTMNLNHLANTATNRFMRTPEIILTYHEKGAVENVTFKVIDANNNLLMEKVVELEVGYQVTDIPTDMKRDFTTYTSTPMTVTEGGENVFTATATFNTPFEISTDFDNAKWYYLNLKNGEGFPTYVESGNPNVTLPATNAENDNTSWAFIGNTYQGFQIINKAAGGNVVLGSALNVQNDGGNGGNTYATLNAPGTKAGETWTIESSSFYTNGFFIRNTDGHALNHRSANNLAYWSGGADAGSTFTATKIPDVTVTYITALENLSNDKVYTIHNTPRAMWMFTETAMAGDPLSGVNIYDEVANPAAKHQIAIVKQNSKYYLYSVAQKKYLAADNKLFNSPLEAVEIIESTAKKGNYMWFFRFEGYTDRNINTNGESKIEINWWSSHDYGNTNAIMETNATYTVDDALAAFTDYTQCVTDYRDYKGVTTDFVNNFGKLGYPKADTEATTAFLAILDRNASGTNTAEDFNTFMEKYNAAMAAENMKMPEVGNFYRIKGVVSGRYMQSSASPEKSDRLGSTEDGTDATTIFYLDEGNKLLGYANGIYTYNTCEASALATNVENAQTYEITLRSMGIFAIKGSGFLYSWPTSENKPYYDRNGNTFHERCQMTIEEVTELPITLRSTDNATYFATFSAPVNVRISGASLNTVTNNNKTAAYNTVDTDMLKAGVGVLLSGTSATATATIITDEVPDADYGLVKYYAATAGTGDESMLYLGKGKTSGKAGFYKLGNGTTSNGFKAYLENSMEFGGAKEGFELEFAGVTGIDNMQNGTLNMENGAVYNLQGQRVNKAQKGVFIQNGKKVVLK